MMDRRTARQTDRQTDRRTDGRTDGWTDGQTTMEKTICLLQNGGRHTEEISCSISGLSKPLFISIICQCHLECLGLGFSGMSSIMFSGMSWIRLAFTSTGLKRQLHN